MTTTLLTVHAGASLTARLAILDAVEKALERQGITGLRIDTNQRPDLVVLADLQDD